MNKEIQIKGKINDTSFIFPFGSRVYGTNNQSSDYDFYVLSDTANNGTEVRNGELNYHLISKDHFKSMLDQYKVIALECYFYSNPPFDFKLNKSLLRKEFSSVSSNSWVKAKKKLEVEKEPYIGLKSLWHSFRIIDFGIQIAKEGKIIDYSSSNDLYHEIISNIGYDWNFFKEKYQQRYNNTCSEFKILAPKD